jgi:phytanoyl-CoA hydroxylase
VWNHHAEDGRFIGLIDPDLIRPEIDRAVPCMGPAGSMSFHHVRALHGSAQNTSDRPRNLLLYEVAASDAWPLLGVKDFAEYDRRLLAGPSTVTPRLVDVPVRVPLPPPLRQGSIYETQSASQKTFFGRAA